MKTLVSQHHISAFYNMLILCISVHNTESIVQSVVRWNEMRFKYKTEQQPLKRVEKRKLSCNFTFPSTFLCTYTIHTHIYTKYNMSASACVSVLFWVLFKKCFNYIILCAICRPKTIAIYRFMPSAKIFSHSHYKHALYDSESMLS